MTTRYQASFTVTADTQGEYDIYRDEVAAHPNVLNLLENVPSLTFTFDYDVSIN